MKHKPARKSVKHTKKSLSRGKLGAGTAYAILAMLVVLSAGTTMIGNVVPVGRQSSDGQPVVILTHAPDGAKSRLQLETFPGVTYTPTPSPTATPTMTPPPPPPSTENNSGGGSGRGSGGGGGGSGSCFVAGTKILMADMSEKNIENIKPGDKIMSYNGVGLSKETVTDVESPVRDHHYEVRLADGTILGITDDHAVYTNAGWEAISPENAKHESPQLTVTELTVGDKVLNSDGNYVAIVDMDYYAGDVQTYNLKGVTGYNNYYANGIVAHNKGGGGGGGSGGGGGGGGGGGAGGVGYNPAQELGKFLLSLAGIR